MNYKIKLRLNWSGYHKYTEENVSEKVPAMAGIYKLSVELKNGNLKLFYVGQAKELNSRLYDHLQSYEQNECIMGKVSQYICHFNFALLAQQEERDGAERGLYLHYKSECNDPNRIPSGPDVDINPN